MSLFPRVIERYRRIAPQQKSTGIILDPKLHKINSLIAYTCSINGDVTFGESVHFHGEVVGNVNVTGEGMLFSLSQRGRVRGDVHAPQVLIAGEVVGDIEGGMVTIAASAKITGKIVYDRLIISEGATLNCTEIVNRRDIEGEVVTPVESAEIHEFGASNKVAAG